MTCPRCGSHDVAIHPITKTFYKNRGCLGWLGWLFLACITFGLILIIPILTNTKVKSSTEVQAVCQNCGRSWRV